MPPSSSPASTATAPTASATGGPSIFDFCSSAAAGRIATASAATAAAVACGLPSTSTVTVPSRVPAAIGACGKSGSGASWTLYSGAGRRFETTINVVSEQLTLTGWAALGMSTVPTGSP